MASTKLRCTHFAFILLSGCAISTDEMLPQTELAQKQSAYLAEPYEVQLVNRSKFDRRFWPTVIKSPYSAEPGMIVTDTEQRFLYYLEKGGMARLYGIAVGARDTPGPVKLS